MFCLIAYDADGLRNILESDSLAEIVEWAEFCASGSTRLEFHVGSAADVLGK